MACPTPARGALQNQPLCGQTSDNPLLQQTEQGISEQAKSLNKLDDGNTIAKVMKEELGYEHARAASMQIQNTLKKLNALMAEVQFDAVEPTMKVMDRAGTPTDELTRRVRERKGKGKGGLE
ncbi:hypothetical protein HF563_02150 [Acidithiobacillus ferridurans]|nr:hypothetical protein [Acidithiobacillus ferridurans]